MTGIKRRLGSLLGPAGYNATGAVEDIATLAQYASAAPGANAFRDAIHDAARQESQQVMGPVVTGLVTESLKSDSAPAVAAASAAEDAVSRFMGQAVKPSTNRFDRTAVTEGVVLSAGETVPTPNSEYVVSDPIPARSGETYVYAEILRATYLDSSGTYVGHDGALGDLLFHATAPDGTSHVRLSVREDYRDIAQMNQGTERLPYEKGGPGRIPSRYLDIEAMRDPRITTSTNLLNREEITLGYGIDATTGEPTPSGSQNISGWIPASPRTTYVVAGFDTALRTSRYAFYDHDKKFLSTGTTGGADAFTTPPGTAWLRITVHNAALDDAYLNQNDTPLPYEPYWVKVGGFDLLQNTGDDAGNGDNSQTTNGPFLIDTDGLDTIYTAPTIQAQSELGSTTTADVYDWYDALVADHPEYVSGTDIGLSSDGVNQLRSYTFRPEPIPTEPDGSTVPELSTPVPVALMISGVHGFEKAAVYHVWRFAKALCEEWQQDKVLDAIRWNIEIVIVPVGNPYGYDASQPDIVQRPNANGVDVARNFPTDWVSGTPGSSTYGGTEPLSEPENIALDQLMDQVSDRAVFGASFHCFTSSPAMGNAVIWQAAASAFTLNLGKQLISRMSRKWNSDQLWITHTRTYYGFADDGAPTGSEGRHLESYGIPGATFEVSRNQRLDDGPGHRHTSEAMTLGYEATVNYIAMGIKEGIDLKNHTRR